MTQLYLEFTTALQATKAEEFYGRCYSASETVRRPDLWPTPVYPQPLEEYDQVEFPFDENHVPPPESYTWAYAYIVTRLPNENRDGGGVLVLDAAMVSSTVPTQQDPMQLLSFGPQTLSDESEYMVDLENDAKTWAQLSPEMQAIIPNPD